MAPARTWLHRLLRKKPGELPTWILSPSGCALDAASSVVTGFGIVASASATWQALHAELNRGGALFAGLGAMALFVGVTAAGLFLLEPCRTAERKARARLRQSTLADP